MLLRNLQQLVKTADGQRNNNKDAEEQQHNAKDHLQNIRCEAEIMLVRCDNEP